jgi:uncharacterized protein YraI
MLMKQEKGLSLLAASGIGIILGLGLLRQAQAGELAQIPTVAIPTVTSSPVGAMAIVTREYDQINVRSGPDAVVYPLIGILIAGQQVPALGRTEGGLWIKIAYPGGPGGVGWVYAPNVELVGSVPIVEPPPTPTPRVTPTVDPTLAAQFIKEVPPTRLPTFTPPPPLAAPTLPSEQAVTVTSRLPMGFVIIGLGVVGLFGMLISILSGR